MSKRFTFKDDSYLFAFYEAVGAYRMAVDLRRSEPAIRSRVAKLKRTGAWDAIAEIDSAHAKYLQALGLTRAEESA
ncbi:hypothetical protein [Roseixanthobacter pseudopolyaromaticivorans]|uniref:hypothetical protein n=1 Tax=Xanthobacteraceae TaxID=335928 RepID=UPI00372ADFB3